MTKTITRALTQVAIAALFVAGPALITGCGDSLDAQGPDASLVSQEGTIAGTWQINLEESDRPGGRLRGQQSNRMRGGRLGGRSGGRAGRSGMGGGPRDGAREEGARLLTIALDDETDGTVTFVRGSGREMTLFTDGRTQSTTLGRGDVEIEVSASWEGDVLVVRRINPRGTITETYSLSPDGTQLIVVTTIENGRLDEPIEFRRVYDPASN